MATALNPLIGYDKGAEIAKRAFQERRPVRELAREMTELGPEAIDRALDPRRQTEPGLGPGGARAAHDAGRRSLRGGEPGASGGPVTGSDLPTRERWPRASDDAVARVGRVAHRTPVATSRTLDELTGARVLLKCENLQRMGAFKFRGAYNTISRLSPEQLGRGVVAYSSGNHAQAVALVARMLGAPGDRDACPRRGRSSRPPAATAPRWSSTTGWARTAKPRAPGWPTSAGSRSSRLRPSRHRGGAGTAAVE